MIQISGVSGSGKSTLIKKLSSRPGFITQDIDDISDKNALKIIEDKKYDYMFNGTTIREFWELLDQMVNMDVRKLIEKSKKDKKILILNGLNSYIYPETIAAYHINTDATTNYARLTKRTMDSICDNKAKIEKLLKTEKNIYKIDLILLYKYQIRISLPDYPLSTEDRIYSRRVEARNAGFKIMEADEIYEEIIGIEKEKPATKKKNPKGNQSASTSRYK